MVVHEVTLRVVLTRRGLRWGLPAALALALPRAAGTADTASLTSYYPPPSAIHQTLVVSGSSSLARDSGHVTFGSRDHDEGRLLVGQDKPADARLRVYGTLRIDGCIWLSNAAGAYRCRWEP